jgi:hypothetical protein
MHLLAVWMQANTMLRQQLTDGAISTWVPRILISAAGLASASTFGLPLEDARGDRQRPKGASCPVTPSSVRPAD